ncbi:PEP-CTERM sorting domain-containing protein [Sphingomonas sp. ID1715]|uniref:PEPxxWA-CTERM sorting domain-containing protein n=1 Tax=Sphingomonas sp. ID1715 TaxID=1656898 RepID=UPI001489ADE9|nr:PEPxxWA-CTERM sorting domain-containing protein [Sphingomonas sp. ID1715]NNM76842.1 PEP-CTERM sorting domain-containing protein [Sphingomonas sp. ID1715]
MLLKTLSAGALLALASAAQADTAADPLGDFLASFTGAQNADLDLVSASARSDGSNFILSSTSAGAIGSSAGSLFVWGINRGQGTPRLSFGNPSIGGNVRFDSVAVFFPDGTARAVTFPAVGAPQITPLAGAVTVVGNTITGVVPIALLPSNGFAPTSYTFTLWSRLRVNPALDGTNAEVADFAPNGRALFASVPEPASWAMMIAGFGLAGAATRRRQAKPVFA